MNCIIDKVLKIQVKYKINKLKNRILHKQNL